jgi:hypothetical protein
VVEIPKAVWISVNIAPNIFVKVTHAYKLIFQIVILYITEELTDHLIVAMKKWSGQWSHMDFHILLCMKNNIDI